MQWLNTITGIGQKSWNTIRSVGPFLISQSDTASEAFQRHLRRLAEAEALNDILKAEVDTRAKLRGVLLERYITASPEDRIRIQQDIDYIDGTMRQFNIAARSLSYKGEKAKEAEEQSQAPKPIEEHWLDRFNEIARKRNEEWRTELLARALSRESEKPGSVSPRALWLIGNMEEELFTALSELLDLCMWSWPDASPLLPHSKTQAFQRATPTRGTARARTVGELIYVLGDVGVVADHLTSMRRIPAGSGIVFRYDQHAYAITANRQMDIRGIMLTPLGEAIAGFYQPRWNPDGLAVLTEWIESLTPEVAESQPVRLAD